MNPSKREFKRIEMLMHTATKQREIYEAGLTDLHEKFKMIAEFNNMDKNILLWPLNPRYECLINQYQHLSGVFMND